MRAARRRVRAGRRHASCRREPRRPLDRRPGRVRPDERRRHLQRCCKRCLGYWRELDAGAPGRLPLPSHLDGRGVRLPRRRGLLRRGDGLSPELALFRLEGRLGPFRARLAPHLRPAGRRHQLLQQLRALSVPRETDPADDPQRRSRASRCRSTATALNVRDWLYVDDHADALITRRRTAAGSARPIRSAAPTSGATSTSSRRSAASSTKCVPDRRIGPREALITYGDGSARPRPALRDRRSKIERELGWRPAENFESGLRKTVAWYLENQWWWERLREPAHRARLGLAV